MIRHTTYPVGFSGINWFRIESSCGVTLVRCCKQDCMLSDVCCIICLQCDNDWKTKLLAHAMSHLGEQWAASVHLL